MAHLTAIPLGRDLDGSNVVSILNIKSLTLANAAATNVEPIRKQEFDASVTALQNQITSITNDPSYKSVVYVDTTSTDLATALAAGTHDGSVFTLGGKQIGAGDIVILNAATEQDSDRAWVHTGGTAGTVADFEPFGSDVDAAIQAVATQLIGSATTYTDLGLVETKLNEHEGEITAIQTSIASHAEQRVFTALAADWVDNGDGSYTLTVPHTYNTSAVMFQVQTDLGSGTWHFEDVGVTLDADITNAHFEFNTLSTDAATHGVRVIATGIPVIV